GVVIYVPVAEANARTTTSLAASPSERPATPATIGDQRKGSGKVETMATRWPSAVRAGWLAGIATLCVSLALAFVRLRRIRRDGLPRPELDELVQSMARRAGIRR